MNGRAQRLPHEETVEFKATHDSLNVEEEHADQPVARLIELEEVDESILTRKRRAVRLLKIIYSF